MLVYAISVITMIFCSQIMLKKIVLEVNKKKNYSFASYFPSSNV